MYLSYICKTVQHRAHPNQVLLNPEAPNGTCPHSFFWMKFEESSLKWEIWKLIYLKGHHSDLMRRYTYHIAFLCFSFITFLREGAQVIPSPLGAAVLVSLLCFVLGIFRCLLSVYKGSFGQGELPVKYSS